ncbi:MAG: methyltransferase [Burkholderiales bacterium]
MLRSYWLTLRDRLLASESFHRFAAWFPLTRPIARREARALFDLVAGFVYSQILYACVRLNLFSILSAGPQSSERLAQQMQLSEDAAQRLLSAAASLRLVESRGPQLWGLGMLGGVMVSNAAVCALVEHHATLYADLRDPVALLRGETNAVLAQYWPYADERATSPTLLTEERVAQYSQLMSASQPLVADEILSAYRFDRHQCLLDVGGGQGTFLIAAAQAFPRLRMILFDLPAVASLAQENFLRSGLQSRASAVGGSFFENSLPVGADVATLIRVLYDHDDHRAIGILRAVFNALASGGTLIVAEPMSETPGAETMGDAYFGFYLLAMGKGRSRSAERLLSMIQEAGFRSCQFKPTRLPLQTSLIEARKP